MKFSLPLPFQMQMIYYCSPSIYFCIFHVQIGSKYLENLRRPGFRPIEAFFNANQVSFSMEKLVEAKNSILLKTRSDDNYKNRSKDVIIMLRLSNLVRTKVPQRLTLRAGLPGWHRPDPPPSAHVPIDHELSDEQIVFTFFDRNMPEFFLTQPEVYEGDTLLQATPMLLKGLGLWAGLALLIGTTLYLTSPLRSTRFYRDDIAEKYESEKQIVQSKQWLKWGRNNQMGVQLSGEYYPQYREGNNEVTASFQQIKGELDSYANTNREIKNYFSELKERCEKTVEERLAHPQDGEKSHDNHH